MLALTMRSTSDATSDGQNKQNKRQKVSEEHDEGISNVNNTGDDELVEFSKKEMKEMKQTIKKHEIFQQVMGEIMKKQQDINIEDRKQNNVLHEEKILLMNEKMQLLQDNCAKKLENQQLQHQLQLQAATYAAQATAAQPAVQPAVQPAAQQHAPPVVANASAVLLCKSFQRHGLIQIVKDNWWSDFKGFDINSNARMTKKAIAQFIVDNGLM